MTQCTWTYKYHFSFDIYISFIINQVKKEVICNKYLLSLLLYHLKVHAPLPSVHSSINVRVVSKANNLHTQVILPHILQWVLSTWQYVYNVIDVNGCTVRWYAD